MAIYTKTGDKGETGLAGGGRVSKSDPRVEAYGEADELSAFLGLLLLKALDKGDRELMTGVQKDLHWVMASLAGAKVDLGFLEERTRAFEEAIDREDKALAPLHHFILPQGTPEAVAAHLCRTVCRRAERAIVRYDRGRTGIIKYLNRLSDLLFTIARKYNKGKEIPV